MEVLAGYGISYRFGGFIIMAFGREVYFSFFASMEEAV